MNRPINYSGVNWNDHNSKIARDLGISRESVRKARKKLGKGISCSRRTIEVDQDGYPTELSLRNIARWGYKWGFRELLEAIKPHWAYRDMGYWKSRGNTYQISTAGWSGNESIINALHKNHIFWAFCWVSSRRGGHYEFEVKS